MGRIPGSSVQVIYDRIASGDPAGIEELYRLTHIGIRSLALGRIHEQDIEDLIQDVMLIMVKQIRHNSLAEPLALLRYMRGVINHQISRHIAQERADRGDGLRPTHEKPLDIEADYRSQERLLFLRRMLFTMADIDREVLNRFYFEGQAAPQICREMGLTIGQFDNLKLRAKEKLRQMIREKNLAAELTLAYAA